MPKKKNKRLTAENETEEVIEAFRQTSQCENSTDGVLFGSKSIISANLNIVATNGIHKYSSCPQTLKDSICNKYV